MALKDALIRVGAPVLKSVVERSLGGIGGRLAGAAIDALAEALGTPPDEAAIIAAIERDPAGAPAKIAPVELAFQQDLARLAEANRDALVSYHGVLLADASAEGWLERRWRPLFAVAFTLCFALITVTVCRAIWISQLTGIDAVAGLIVTLIVAGCAVLGVQVWQKGEAGKPAR
jgi:hypothetical protein